MDARSIAEVPEHELVPLILRHDPLRRMVLAATGAHFGSVVHFRVPSSELCSDASAIGDVDALIYQSMTPEFAAAYEFKRVKVARQTFRTGRPNKLSALSKAVHQANALERIGFSRVALVVLLVTDGRERVEFNFAFRGATPELLRTVDTAIDLSDLHPDVGVFRMEVVQWTDRDITLSGGISGKSFRMPRIRSQSSQLTGRIKGYAYRATRA